jgi:hypothetical protein
MSKLNIIWQLPLIAFIGLLIWLETKIYPEYDFKSPNGPFWKGAICHWFGHPKPVMFIACLKPWFTCTRCKQQVWVPPSKRQKYLNY